LAIACLLPAGAFAFEMWLSTAESAAGGVVTITLDTVPDLPGDWTWQLWLGPSLVFTSNETGQPGIVSFTSAKDGNATVVYRLPALVPGDRLLSLYVHPLNRSAERKAVLPFRIAAASYAQAGAAVELVPGANFTARIDGLPVPAALRAYLFNGSAELFTGNITGMPADIPLAMPASAWTGNNSLTLQVNGTDYAQFPIVVRNITSVLNLSQSGTAVPGQNLTVVVERPPRRSTYAVLFDGSVLAEGVVAAERLALALAVPAVPAFSTHNLSLRINDITVSEHAIIVGRAAEEAATPQSAPEPAPVLEPAPAPPAENPLVLEGLRPGTPWWAPYAIVGGAVLLLGMGFLARALRKRRQLQDQLPPTE
jgi:hypothetical protein